MASAIERRRASALLSRVSNLALIAVATLSPATVRAQDLAGAGAAGSETTLDVIDVTATAAGATEGGGSYAAQGVTPSATGLPLSPRELPQSVSVVTDQEILDQNFQTLNEIVDYAPGLTAAQGNGEMRWGYYARGSAIVNLQFDGVPSYTPVYGRDILPQDDVAIYDRIEVVRGATGLLEGTGNPSASVNLVRKRPLDIRQIQVETGISTFGAAQVTFDASSPLNAAGTVRGRVIAKGLGGDGPRDNLGDDRGLVYGVLDFDIGARTTASVGAMYAREDIDGYSWGGLWTDYDGAFFDFDGDASPSLEWEYSEREATTGYVDIEHRFDNGWTLKAAGRGVDGDATMLGSYMYWAETAPGEINLFRDGSRFAYNTENYSLDVQAAGAVTLFGRSHELAFGANGGRDRTRYDSPAGYNFLIPDPTVADPYAEPKPSFGEDVNFWDVTNTQYGAYAAARINVTDRLKVIGGGRVTWFDYHENGSYAGDLGYSVDGEFVPYVGAVYDVNETWSVYASFTEIFQPEFDYGVDGLLPPVEGANIEAGVKADLLDGRLTAAAAIFRTDRAGLPEVDPDADPVTDTCGPPSDPTCYQSSGEVRTQGAEIEISGAVTDRLNLSASYTYADSEYREGENAGDRYEPNVSPRNIAKLAGTYAMGGALEGLTVGGALRWQSETYIDGAGDFSSGGQPYRMRQGGYAVVDAMARYDFDERTSLQVNVENLFDKTYYTSFSNPGYGNFIGAARSATLTLRQTF